MKIAPYAADGSFPAMPAMPAVTGVRTSTVDTCLQNLAFLCDRFDTANTASADVLAAMRLVLDRLVGLGLPHDLGPDGVRRFDLVELRNFINIADHQFDDPFWQTEAMPLGRRLMLGSIDEQHPALGVARAFPPRRFRLQVSRTYGRRFLKQAQSCRLRLPIPLEDAALTGLSVALLAPQPHEIIRSSRTPGRLDIIVNADDMPELTVAAAFDFVSRPDANLAEVAALDPREKALALGAAEGLIRITPAVRDLAEKLAGDVTDAMTIVRRFWDHLHAVLNLGWLRHSQLDSADPVISILNLGWVDCRLAAVLLVALCRSRQLPARVVGGFQLQPTRPGYHYWAEVWVSERGWLPFDTLGFAVTRPGDGSPWRDVYFGCIDYRARVECLPHLFTGLPSFRLPLDWHLNITRIEGGVRTRLEESSSGEAVYSEDVTCEVLQ